MVIYATARGRPIPFETGLLFAPGINGVCLNTYEDHRYLLETDNDQQWIRQRPLAVGLGDHGFYSPDGLGGFLDCNESG